MSCITVVEISNAIVAEMNLLSRVLLVWGLIADICRSKHLLPKPDDEEFVIGIFSGTLVF